MSEQGSREGSLCLFTSPMLRPRSEETVLDDGITIILRSFNFMPDNVERRHGVTSAAIIPSSERAF